MAYQWDYAMTWKVSYGYNTNPAHRPPPTAHSSSTPPTPLTPPKSNHHCLLQWDGVLCWALFWGQAFMIMNVIVSKYVTVFLSWLNSECGLLKASQVCSLGCRQLRNFARIIACFSKTYDHLSWRLRTHARTRIPSRARHVARTPCHAPPAYMYYLT